jgi:lipopolysaccharide biosynthesis glycosyltransferase
MLTESLMQMCVDEAVCAISVSSALTLQGQGKMLAAVRDFGIPCGHSGLQTLGWAGDQGSLPSYFNAGVLLLHMPTLRKSLPRIQQLLATCCTDRQEQVLKYADQDVLNVICMEMGGYVELEPRWNVQVQHRKSIHSKK